MINKIRTSTNSDGSGAGRGMGEVTPGMKEDRLGEDP